MNVNISYKNTPGLFERHKLVEKCVRSMKKVKGTHGYLLKRPVYAIQRNRYVIEGKRIVFQYKCLQMLGEEVPSFQYYESNQTLFHRVAHNN